jgi:uncharacterized protein
MTAAITEKETSVPTATRQRRIHNAVWFELPVADLPRAIGFYEHAFAVSLKVDPRFPGLAIFPRVTDNAVTGALIEQLSGEASGGGTTVYLNCDGDLDGVLKRIKASGGKVLQEVAQLPGSMGWIARIRDLDGNVVGLHAAF